jgi:UDP-N-acetylmuramate: L-alanyl-gamma-D-glutamyl-meso-diaminopimelate ligase
VVSNVLGKDHPEVKEGRRLGLKQMSFPEVLESFILPTRKSFVVAGTHGKTTTSSILSHILEPCGAGRFVGGVLKSGEPGCYLGQEGAPFVLEGDEYDTCFFDKHSKFLHYGPQVLLLTHLEWDHVDIFPTFDDMLNEFKALIALLPLDGLLVYCGDHPELCQLSESYQGKKISYGVDSSNDFVLRGSSFESGVCRVRLEGAFQVSDDVGGPFSELKPKSSEIKEIKTKMLGRIYHLNLLGAMLAAHFGHDMSWSQIQDALGHFTGARRRMELLREDRLVVISDFAHHPTAISETIDIVRQYWPDRQLLAVFDPRNATSRRNVFQERLARSFVRAHGVMIGPPPLDKRLSEEDRLDVIQLAEQINQLMVEGEGMVDEKRGAPAMGFCDSSAFVSSVEEKMADGGVILVMSCGSCHGLLQVLTRDLPLEP